MLGREIELLRDNKPTKDIKRWVKGSVMEKQEEMEENGIDRHQWKERNKVTRGE